MAQPPPPLPPMECDGSPYCRAPRHNHGCFSERRVASTTETAKPSNQELAAAMYKLRLDDPLGHYFSQAQTRALVARVEALLAERDALAQALSDARYLGDNHHNAAACPHCGDLLGKEKGRVAVLEAALRDECEMNEQSLATLRDLLAHWERLGEQRTPDGEPVIEEELRGLIDDLDTSSARAVLAGGDAAPQTDNLGGDEVASSGGGS